MNDLGRYVVLKSFVAREQDGELSVDDPNFWEKIVPGGMSIGMLGLKFADKSAFATRNTKLAFLTKLRQVTEQIPQSIQSDRQGGKQHGF